MSVDLASLIVDVPDFPRPGISFFDIPPLLASPAGLAIKLDQLAPRDRLLAQGVTSVTSLLRRGDR